MKTFENFRKVINESDYILSEAQRYLEILLEKDSEALKQYKASKKSFQKGFGKNIKPTVVQPGLDLYKAGGPYVPDKTTFKDTGKKVPKMEPKPQFGTPKTTKKTGAPDKTLLKKAIKDVKDSERRLFQKGLGKGTAGVKGVKGKPGISLPRQRKYTNEIIKDLSAKTTQSDARLRGSSTEGSAGASSSSKTVTPTKPQKSASAIDYTKKINQANKNRKEFTGNKKSFQNFKQQADAATNKLVSKREVVRSYTGKKDVQKLKDINKQIKSTERISKGYDLASKGKGNLKSPVVRASDLKQVTDNTSKPVKSVKPKNTGNPKITRNYTRGKKPYVTKTTVTGDSSKRGRPKNYAKSKGSSIPNPNKNSMSYYKSQGRDAFDLTKNPTSQGKPITYKGEPQLPKFIKNNNPSFKSSITSNKSGFDGFYSDKAYKTGRSLPKPVQKLGKSKIAQKILKSAIKNPYVAGAAAVIGTAAAGYGAYKALTGRKKQQKALSTKDLKPGRTVTHGSGEFKGKPVRFDAMSLGFTKKKGVEKKKPTYNDFVSGKYTLK